MASGVGEIACDQLEARRRCYNLSMRKDATNRKRKFKTNTSIREDRIEPIDEHKEIELVKDFRGINPEVIVHRLNVDPTMRPVQQRKRTFGVEKNRIIQDESMSQRPLPIAKDRSAGRFDRKIRFSMMDAYQGYHQISMAEEDRSKTSFVTEQGIFCYNAREQDVQKPDRIDNGSVRRRYAGKQRLEAHLQDLEEAFAIMRTYGMKLNPTKCTFGVGGGKFLGYMVSSRGIETNPKKIDAILQLKSPTSIKDVQKLTVVSGNAISSVLVREENRVQNPVYYVSKMLQGAESRYSIVEKIVLALVTTTRKLRPYFQSHKVIVLTNQPLKSILSRPDASRRLVKWVIELGEYDIDYRARTSEKAQILADFVVELSGESIPKAETWMLHVDRSSNANNGGVPKGVEIEVAARLSFSATNNEAEYEALILGLELAHAAGQELWMYILILNW
ncbi:UNVERIFIED_CONTAM: hypothetical protein Sindi_0949900 [Sesamum indicum]